MKRAINIEWDRDGSYEKVEKNYGFSICEINGELFDYPSNPTCKYYPVELSHKVFPTGDCYYIEKLNEGKGYITVIAYGNPLRSEFIFSRDSFMHTDPESGDEVGKLFRIDIYPEDQGINIYKQPSLGEGKAAEILLFKYTNQEKADGEISDQLKSIYELLSELLRNCNKSSDPIQEKIRDIIGSYEV